MTNTKQLSARERINYLLDDNSFVEIGAMVTKRNTDFNLSQKEAPSDGVITGYGLINNSPVYVYSQDISVLNGTIGEMHAKKIASLYEFALKVGAPIIGLIDCGGIRISESTDALEGLGEIYLKQIKASGVIPQISAIFGECGGANAISVAMTDFTFITKNGGKLFVCPPNTLENNYVEKCDTSSAENVSVAGNVEFVYDDDESLLQGIRDFIEIIPANNKDRAVSDNCVDDLNRQCSDLSVSINSKEIFSSISDNNLFVEIKKDYAKEIVAGFIKLNGMTIGGVANGDSILSVDGCKKAEKFIRFCNSFNIPVLTLTNVSGYKATKCSEKNMAVSVANLIKAFVECNAPKVNLITDKAYGSAYIAMNSKHIGADMVFAWENTKVGTMDSKNAVQIIYADEISQAEDKLSFINEKENLYTQALTSVESAAKRGYIDSIIAPEDTRKNLIYIYEMLYNKNF